MTKFSCLPTIQILKKKKSKQFSKDENNLKEQFLPASKSFLSKDKGSSFIPKVLSNVSLDEEIQSMKIEDSDFDLQSKELDSLGSNIEFKTGIFGESKFEIELTASSDSPVLKRSCSNIETLQPKQWINSPTRSCSFSNLQNFTKDVRAEINSETNSSSLSIRSSSYFLPSCSRMIWCELLLQSQKNFPLTKASQKLVSVVYAPNQNNKLEETWKNSSNEFSIFDVNSEKDCDEMDEEKTANLNSLESIESSDEKFPNNNRLEVVEVMQTNNVIQSLNMFSTVACIAGIGLKDIPPISAFSCLRSVNLSGNCIVTISPGSLPKSLHTLDLSRNKISTIEGLRDLERLKVLNLSYNRIAKIGYGVSSCTLIKELYLAGNKISNVEGLHRLPKLKVLDLSFNKIITGKGLSQLVANYNSLLALNLLGNPIMASIGDDQLRKEVLSLLPHVTYLNKKTIKPHKVREVVSERVTKAALGDAAGSSKRKLTKRMSQSSSSFAKNKVSKMNKYEHSMLAASKTFNSVFYSLT